MSEPVEMTRGEVLEQELDAVMEMAAQVGVLKSTLDPLSKEYYALQNDYVMLEQTAYYLTRRLKGSIPPYYINSDSE